MYPHSIRCLTTLDQIRSDILTLVLSSLVTVGFFLWRLSGSLRKCILVNDRSRTYPSTSTSTDPTIFDGPDVESSWIERDVCRCSLFDIKQSKVLAMERRIFNALWSSLFFSTAGSTLALGRTALTFYLPSFPSLSVYYTWLWSLLCLC